MTNNLTESYEVLVNGPDILYVLMGRISKLLDLIDQKMTDIPTDRLRVSEYDETNMRQSYTYLRNFYSNLCEIERNIEYEKSPMKATSSSGYTPPTYVNLDEAVQRAISKKSHQSGISADILSEVYCREILETENPTKAFERVNSFVSDGRSRKIDDADLWRTHVINEAAIAFFAEECDCEKDDEEAPVVEKTTKSSKLRKTVREAFEKRFGKDKDAKDSGKSKDKDKKSGDGEGDEPIKDPSGKKDKVLVDPEERESVGE